LRECEPPRLHARKYQHLLLIEPGCHEYHQPDCEKEAVSLKISLEHRNVREIQSAQDQGEPHRSAEHSDVAHEEKKRPDPEYGPHRSAPPCAFRHVLQSGTPRDRS
jgi:hypothetical protein